LILKKPYKDINDTLTHLKIQVKDSLPFVCAIMPKMRDPEVLFNWLKKRTVYRNDPSGVELLQTAQTMLRGKYWGKQGAGDCDCFVITTLACCICQGWHDLYIALVGRERGRAVHIYTVIYWKGERIVFDLTNKAYNYERDGYNYIQEIPVHWEKWGVKGSYIRKIN
jgi:hypothetical protein